MSSNNIKCNTTLKAKSSVVVCKSSYVLIRVLCVLVVTDADNFPG
jgi:hypothetical protein